MIKKSVFEHDLITGMQHELRKQSASEAPNLIRAGECLHAALEILEEAGLQKDADRVLEVMRKIAVGEKTRPLQKMPSMQALHEAGLTDEDIENFRQGQHHAKVKMNAALRLMDYTDKDIADFIGKHNLITGEEVSRYIKLLDMIKHPAAALEHSEIPSEITMESTLLPEDETKQPEEGEGTLSFRSLANKPKRSDKISDVHTKKLTPEKMLSNLKHHGTEFNMPDLGWADFDPELAEVLDAKNADQLLVDDESMNWDLDLSDDFLQAESPQVLEDFEDEVSK